MKIPHKILDKNRLRFRIPPSKAQFFGVLPRLLVHDPILIFMLRRRHCNNEHKSAKVFPGISSMNRKSSEFPVKCVTHLVPGEKFHKCSEELCKFQWISIVKDAEMEFNVRNRNVNLRLLSHGTQKERKKQKLRLLLIGHQAQSQNQWFMNYSKTSLLRSRLKCW